MTFNNDKHKDLNALYSEQRTELKQITEIVSDSLGKTNISESMDGQIKKRIDDANLDLRRVHPKNRIAKLESYIPAILDEALSPFETIVNTHASQHRRLVQLAKGAERHADILSNKKKVKALQDQLELKKEEKRVGEEKKEIVIDGMVEQRTESLTSQVTQHQNIIDANNSEIQAIQGDKTETKNAIKKLRKQLGFKLGRTTLVILCVLAGCLAVNSGYVMSITFDRNGLPPVSGYAVSVLVVVFSLGVGIVYQWLSYPRWMFYLSFFLSALSVLSYFGLMVSQTLYTNAIAAANTASTDLFSQAQAVEFTGFMALVEALAKCQMSFIGMALCELFVVTFTKIVLTEHQRDRSPLIESIAGLEEKKEALENREYESFMVIQDAEREVATICEQINKPESSVRADFEDNPNVVTLKASTCKLEGEITEIAKQIESFDVADPAAEKIAQQFEQVAFEAKEVARNLLTQERYDALRRKAEDKYKAYAEESIARLMAKGNLYMLNSKGTADTGNKIAKATAVGSLFALMLFILPVNHAYSQEALRKTAQIISPPGFRSVAIEKKPTPVRSAPKKIDSAVKTTSENDTDKPDILPLTNSTAKPHAPPQISSNSVNDVLKLSDVVVDTCTPKISIHDYCVVDGDRVRVTINGEVFLNDLEIKEKSQEFQLHLKPGKNSVVVTALNEGSQVTNTAALRIDDVKQGNGEQKWRLSQQENDSFNIYVILE